MMSRPLLETSRRVVGHRISLSTIAARCHGVLRTGASQIDHYEMGYLNGIEFTFGRTVAVATLFCRSETVSDNYSLE